MINQETEKIKEMKKMTNDILIDYMSLGFIRESDETLAALHELTTSIGVKPEDKSTIETMLINTLLSKYKDKAKYYKTLFKYGNTNEILSFFSSYTKHIDKLNGFYREDPVEIGKRGDREGYLMRIFIYYMNSNSYSPADKRNVFDNINYLYSILSGEEDTQKYKNMIDNSSKLYEEARNIIRGIRDTKKTITDLDNKGLNVKELETSFYTNVDKAISNLPIMLYKAVDNLSNNKKLVK